MLSVCCKEVTVLCKEVTVLCKEVRATFTPTYIVPSVYPPSRGRLWGELRKTIVVIGQRSVQENVEKISNLKTLKKMLDVDCCQILSVK